MRVTRMLLRVVGAMLFAMIAVWFALRSVDASDESFPSWLRANLESGIRLFAVCLALLILVELGRRVASRLRR